MVAQNVKIAREVLQKIFFQPQILHYWARMFRQNEDFQTIFNSPKFRSGSSIVVLPNSAPPLVMMRLE